MGERFPDVTDMDSLNEWIRRRGFDPAAYGHWDYARDGHPPWAELEFTDSGWAYHWPMICTERRVMGVVRLDGSDE